MIIVYLVVGTSHTLFEIPLIFHFSMPQTLHIRNLRCQTHIDFQQFVSTLIFASWTTIHAKFEAPNIKSDPFKLATNQVYISYVQVNLKQKNRLGKNLNIFALNAIETARVQFSEQELIDAGRNNNKVAFESVWIDLIVIEIAFGASHHTIIFFVANACDSNVW